MRRFHVLPISIVAFAAAIALVAFAAAIALVAFAGPASASRAPAGPKRQRAVKAVTLATAPNPSTARQPIVLSGRVVGFLRAGTLVSLWRKRPRDRRFHIALQTRTDRKGRYALLASGTGVDTNSQWYAATHGVASPISVQHVRALLTLKSSTTAAAPGDRVGLSGHATPWHGGDRVLLQRAWKVCGTFARAVAQGKGPVYRWYLPRELALVRRLLVGGADCAFRKVFESRLAALC